MSQPSTGQITHQSRDSQDNRQQAEETVTLSELASQTQSLHQHLGPCDIVDSVTTVHPHAQPEECHDLGYALLITDV